MVKIKSITIAMLVMLSMTIVPMYSKKVSSQGSKTEKKAKKRAKKVAKKKKKAKKRAKKDTPKKAFKDLTYDDLKKAKNKLVAAGKKETAIKHIEKMIPLCNDIQELRNLTLEVADLLFDTGSRIKAEQLYTQFVQLYPGDPNIEYVSYKALLCCFWQTLDAERDQSKTKQAITLAQNFLDRSAVFTEYTDEVTNILVTSQNRLFDSEVNVFKFYLKQGDFLSAQSRLTNIEKDFLTALPEKEQEIIILTCELAEKQNNKELLAQKQGELKEKFPEIEESITLAKGPKHSFVSKF